MENYRNLKAVSLAYDQQKGNAPTVTAQGTGHNAKTIIQIAKEHNVPIKKDEDLINILSQIEVNQEIPEELYKAVAEIFSFIYNMSNE